MMFNFILSILLYIQKVLLLKLIL